LGAIVSEFSGLSYKWPNDVLIRDRKLAGILLESELSGGEAPDFLVIGVGVNIVASPQNVEYPATSLVEEGMGAVSPAALLDELARYFDCWGERWRRDGFAAVRTAWRARANALGKPIRVRLDTGTLHGRFLDIDEEGALVLEVGEGRRRISAGEIFPAAIGCPNRNESCLPVA